MEPLDDRTQQLYEKDLAESRKIVRENAAVGGIATGAFVGMAAYLVTSSVVAAIIMAGVGGGSCALGEYFRARIKYYPIRD